MIVINLHHPAIAPYLKVDPDLAADVFVPLLGHEISHDKVLGHGNPFYSMQSILTRELREVVAKDKIRSRRRKQVTTGEL